MFQLSRTYNSLSVFFACIKLKWKDFFSLILNSHGIYQKTITRLNILITDNLFWADIVQNLLCHTKAVKGLFFCLYWTKKKGLITFHFSKNMFHFENVFRNELSFSKGVFIFKMWKVSWVFFLRSINCTVGGNCAEFVVPYQRS